MLLRLRPAPVVYWFTATLLIICSLIAYVPVSPSFPDSSLDSAWAFALNGAVAKGLIFGRDLIFTFGPYASAYTQQYHPATDARMLWSASILGLAFASGLICLSRRWQIVPSLLLTITLVILARDTLFFLVPFTFLLLVCRTMMPETHPARIVLYTPVMLSLALLVVALGLLPLVKATFAAASGSVMALGWLLLMVCRKFLYATVAAVLFFITMPITWLLASQPLAQLPLFFAAQAPIVSGYTDAMSIPGPAWQVSVFLSCSALLVLIHARHLLSAGASGPVLLAGTTTLLFLAFKEGFVRQDGHVLIAAGLLALIAYMLTLGARGVTPTIGLVLGITAWIGVDRDVTGLTPAAAAMRIREPFATAIHMLTVRLTAPAELARGYENSLIAIRAEQVLPELHGTVDIYSVGQSAVLARGFDWAPRPVVQSYSAYTSSLEQADARHLTGVGAPTNVIFSVQPFGDRLPALDDGASWPILLTGYDVTMIHNNAAVLLRHAPRLPAPIESTPIVDRTFRLGESVALPLGTRGLWAELSVSPTLAGRLVSFFYKPPPLRISYQFADGHRQNFRYVAGMGHGFLAVPLVLSTMDFVALRLPESKSYFVRRRPLSMSISSSYAGGWLWNASYRAKLSEIVIPAQLGVNRLLFDPTTIEAARRATLPTTSDCSIDLINQHTIGRTPVEVGKFLRVEGWGVISMKNALSPDAISVTLTSPEEKVHTIPTQRVARDDVNRYFGRPEMGKLGYVASADLADASGDYMLRLELSRGGQTWLCDHAMPIHVNHVLPRRSA